MAINLKSARMVALVVCIAMVTSIITVSFIDTSGSAPMLRYWNQPAARQYYQIVPLLIERKLTKYYKPPVAMHIKNISLNYVTCSVDDSNGRLGNKMHNVASIISIALANNMIPYYDDFSAFNGRYAKSKYDAKTLSRAQAGNWIQYGQRHGVYDPVVFNLSSISKYQGRNIELVGHLSVYKVIEKYQDLIRQEFVFSKNVRDQVVKFFLTIDEKHHDSILNKIWIGIHVRRGDMLREPWKSQGFSPPGAGYYNNAIQHMRTLFGKNLFFVVCGNNETWMEENIKPLDPNMVISEQKTAEVDMAILSSCDHVIKSVGSYGWWSAFLAGGQVIYYSNYPRPGSEMAFKFHRKDVYPSHWVGLE